MPLTTTIEERYAKQGGDIVRITETKADDVNGVEVILAREVEVIDVPTEIAKFDAEIADINGRISQAQARKVTIDSRIGQGQARIVELEELKARAQAALP